MQSNIKTVSQLTSGLKHVLESEFRFIHVTGEVSNLRVPFSGHAYFILKDQNAQIRCVLFKGQKRYLDKPLKDGQKIVCHGRITVYEPRGDYQILIDTIDHSGIGDLQAQFEKLKQKLNKEGLFESNIKKSIPPNPENVTVITSPTGAALQDFLKVHSLKFSNCSISIIPVAVQGHHAAREISEAIQLANEQIDTDCIVICRGGGSLEDLWAFNEEPVARAIYKSKLPVISAIGHEIDFTISDFCADARCPTPTAAAELLFTDTSENSEKLFTLKRRLANSIKTKLEFNQQQLRYHLKLLINQDNLLFSSELKLDHTYTRMVRIYKDQLQQKELQLNRLTSALETQFPKTNLAIAENRLSHLQEKLIISSRHLLDKKEGQFIKVITQLDGVSPLATLSRGYSIVQKKTGHKKTVISKTGQLNLKDRLDITLHQGEFECEVTRISK